MNVQVTSSKQPRKLLLLWASRGIAKMEKRKGQHSPRDLRFTERNLPGLNRKKHTINSFPPSHCPTPNKPSQVLTTTVSTETSEKKSGSHPFFIFSRNSCIL
ncbi:hypothetical protein AVEN_84350-1 [Araneus ventricosus]|uniref:Uncharacterized protein n=1 Tax=Araneus ventricosus TaxID=182803 RepID=A0A4Y2RY55_ARAVE|nr:hypothetical protein AVEN_84350-1 [Araneus ventricosus]